MGMLGMRDGMPEGEASWGKLRQHDSAAIRAEGENVGGGQEAVASRVWSAVGRRSELGQLPWRSFAAAAPVSRAYPEAERRDGRQGAWEGDSSPTP